MAKLTVYGTPVSVYVRIVRLLLEEAGVEYGLKGVDIFNGENQSADYLAKNPFGKVPTLEVDGELIYETTAITGYLDNEATVIRYRVYLVVLLAFAYSLVANL